MTEHTDQDTRPDECQKALNLFAARDFREWTGLPSGCSLSDILQRFRLLNDAVGLGPVGERSVEYRMVVAQGYERPLRVWFENAQVLMMDVAYPVLVTPTPDLVAHLGEPDAKLDSYLTTYLLRQSEWVYPARGLTLFINPENLVLLRLAVYPAGTLAVYEQELRIDLRMRRLPLNF